MSNLYSGPVGSAAIATVCAVASHNLACRQAELTSEILCWVSLPLLYRGATRWGLRTGSENEAPHSSPSLCMFAACIGAVAVYKSETGPLVGFLPALTLLLLLAQTHLRLAAPRNEGLSPSALANTVWGTSAVALFATLALTNWDPRGSFLSVFAVMGLLVAYVALEPKNPGSHWILPAVNFDNDIESLSAHVLVVMTGLLALNTLIFGFPTSGVISTLALGLCKALAWYFTAQTARDGTWRVATVIGTFASISTRNPFTQPSDFLVFSHVAAAMLVLGQLIYTLPKQAKARALLWALAVVPFAPLIANLAAIKISSAAAMSFVARSRDHPVEQLASSGKVLLENLTKRQSTNIAAAKAEYRKRYGIEPPPGFQSWFEYAKAHNSPIIDDFDTIWDSISPFLNISGVEVANIMNEAYNAVGSDLWMCEFFGESSRTSCVHPQREFDRHYSLLFDTLLKDLPGIPATKFLINHLDEPRMVLPRKPDHLVTITDLSHKPVWDEITKFCGSKTAPNNSLPFVSDVPASMDLCQHPEYSSLHGFFMSPSSCKLIQGLVPVLSTGAPSSMGDVIFPSPAYMEREFKYDASHDVDWAMKKSNLYWAGSTTGGYAHDERWKLYHRQRFVALAKNLDSKQHSYLRRRDSVIDVIKSTFLNTRLFDATITRINQCDSRYCKDETDYFDVKGWADGNKVFQSQLAFDMDGNGISGRYYKMLASNSLPLKQTLFREWHDERLVPWVHYVPISQGMEELPEVVSHLLLSEAGQETAQSIARQGQEWYSKALREVDLGIYTYRLVLELARLQDPKRGRVDVGL